MLFNHPTFPELIQVWSGPQGECLATTAASSYKPSVLPVHPLTQPIISALMHAPSYSLPFSFTGQREWTFRTLEDLSGWRKILKAVYIGNWLCRPMMEMDCILSCAVTCDCCGLLFSSIRLTRIVEQFQRSINGRNYSRPYGVCRYGRLLWNARVFFKFFYLMRNLWNGRKYFGAKYGKT